MSKCKAHPYKEAIHLNMCESCVEGLIEDLNCDNATKDERIKEFEAELDKRDEIETDLNSTVSYLEMGVSSWKDRATELEAELEAVLIEDEKLNNQLMKDIADLQAELTKLRKEHNDLIEKVSIMEVKP